MISRPSVALCATADGELLTEAAGCRCTRKCHRFRFRKWTRTPFNSTTADSCRYFPRPNKRASAAKINVLPRSPSRVNICGRSRHHRSIEKAEAPQKGKRNKRQVATCVRSFELESSSGGPTATISSISLLCAFVVSRRHEKVPPRGRRRSQSKQSRVACSLLGQKTEIVSPQLHGRPFSAFSLRPLLLHGAKRNLRAKCCDHRKINPSAEQMEADSSPKR